MRISDTVDAAGGARKNLRVVDCTDPAFAVLWNEFLAASPIYTYRHELRVFDYWKLVMGDALKDRSFLLAGKDDRPRSSPPSGPGSAPGLPG